MFWGKRIESNGVLYNKVSTIYSVLGIKISIPHFELYSPNRPLSNKEFLDQAKKKYKKYKPARFGDGMQPYVDWILSWTNNLKIENIFEIGANYGQDADYLRNAFCIEPKNVYVFEAHPEIYKAITEIHDFNAYNNAVFDKQSELYFNIVDVDYHNTGISSLLPVRGVKMKSVKVQSIRMDDFLNKNQIESVDFLKLDVEGVNYEVLKGFGERLKDVKVIQTEAEHRYIFGKENHLFDEIKILLESNGFVMVMFENTGAQSDSLWVKKEYIRCKPSV